MLDHSITGPCCRTDALIKSPASRGAFNLKLPRFKPHSQAPWPPPHSLTQCRQSTALARCLLTSAQPHLYLPLLLGSILNRTYKLNVHTVSALRRTTPKWRLLIRAADPRKRLQTSPSASRVLPRRAETLMIRTGLLSPLLAFTMPLQLPSSSRRQPRALHRLYQAPLVALHSALLLPLEAQRTLRAPCSRDRLHLRHLQD